MHLVQADGDGGGGHGDGDALRGPAPPCLLRPILGTDKHAKEGWHSHTPKALSFHSTGFCLAPNSAWKPGGGSLQPNDVDTSLSRSHVRTYVNAVTFSVSAMLDWAYNTVLCRELGIRHSEDLTELNKQR